MSVRRLLPLLLLTACEPGKVQLDGPDETGGETGTDTSDTSDTSHTGETDSADTSDTSDTSHTGETAETDTGEPGPVFTELAVSTDAEVVTLLHVSWTQARPTDTVWVEFRFEDDSWLRSPVRPGAVGAHTEVLLGVPAEQVVDWRLVGELGEKAVTAEGPPGATGSLPRDLTVPVVNTWEPGLASGERYMLGSVDVSDHWYYGPFWAFIVDRQGRVVWYRETPGSKLSLYVQPSRDNTHVYVDNSTQYVFDGSQQPGVTRLTLDGRWQEEIEIESYGFPSDELDGGGILYESRESGVRLAVRWPDGSDEVLWDCSAYMREVGGRESGCNPNTIVWDPERNTVFWSMYKIDHVFEVDLGAGEVVRSFGQQHTIETHAFDPLADVVDYQHYVNWTPEGTILASTHVLGEPNVQVTNEYAVDDDAATLSTVWTYEGTGFYAEYAGEAQRLAEGNTLIGYGTDGAVREVTPDGQIAWEIVWEGDRSNHLVGHMTLLDDLYALNEGPG